MRERAETGSDERFAVGAHRGGFGSFGRTGGAAGAHARSARGVAVGDGERHRRGELHREFHGGGDDRRAETFADVEINQTGNHQKI